MSKRTATKASTISYMVDDSSDDEFARDNDANMLTKDQSTLENVAPPKKRGPKPKAAASITSTKPAATRASRRVSGDSVAPSKARVTKAKPGPKRKALTQRQQEPNASETEEVDEFVGGEEEEGDMKRDVCEIQETQQPSPKRPARRGRRPNPKPEAEDGKKKKPATKAAKAAAAAAATKREPSSEPAKFVPETQPDPEDLDPMDIEPTIETITTEIEEPAARAACAGGRKNRAGSVLKQPLQPQPSSRRRVGSASDTERAGNDPALRRKLGDLTKKFDNLDMKYQNLREVGVRDAEINFAKLKKSADDRAKAQDDMIASLKKELAAQRALGSESKSLRSELASLKKVNEKLSSENESLQSRLSDTQSEVKTLTTKLSATRAASASVQAPESKVPGSAVKSSQRAGGAIVGSGEAAKDPQIRQLKEDLYGDLTGLIVRGVKRGDEEDVYDCIQTGRNGTLHFHLSVAVDAPGKPSQSSYEDAEFAYSPLLDENRDRDLLDILPDYLTEEICFPRSSAAKFYAKVVDCMTKKVVVED